MEGGGDTDCVWNSSLQLFLLREDTDRHEVSTELSVQQKKTERHAVESNVLLYDSKLAGKVKPDLICYCIKNKTITRSLFSVSPLACISIMTQ